MAKKQRKLWWKSKTILAGVIFVGIGLYEAWIGEIPSALLEALYGLAGILGVVGLRRALEDIKQ